MSSIAIQEFWLLLPEIVLAVFGMALKYAECTLSMKYRVILPDAGASGGPNRFLLGLWLLGAVALAWFAFTAGIPGLVDQQVAPYEAYRINVMASQDGWDFIYPNGHVTDTLTVRTLDGTTHDIEITINGMAASVLHAQQFRGAFVKFVVAHAGDVEMHRVE